VNGYCAHVGGLCAEVRALWLAIECAAKSIDLYAVRYTVTLWSLKRASVGVGVGERLD